MAIVRFWYCDLSFWQTTFIPVGRWVILTAVEFFCTLCPPWPPARKASMLMSSSFTVTSTPSSTSGITSTSANDVCLAWSASNGDSLTSLCTPRSDLKISVGIFARDLQRRALYPALVAR